MPLTKVILIESLQYKYEFLCEIKLSSVKNDIKREFISGSLSMIDVLCLFDFETQCIYDLL